MSLNFKQQKGVFPANPVAGSNYNRFTLTINALANLTTDFNTRGILVDNTSGYWMLIEPFHIYVPPYTLGYRYSPQPGSQYLTISWGSGPNGSVVSTSGDAPILWAYDAPVGYFPGYPYLPNFPAILQGAGAVGLGAGVNSGSSLVLPVLAGANAGKHYRIYQMSCNTNDATGAPATSTVMCRWQGSVTGNVIGWSSFAPATPVGQGPLYYPWGIDLAVGEGLTFFAQKYVAAATASGAQCSFQYAIV